MKLILLALFLLSSATFAADCNFKITGNDNLQFDLKEIRVPKDCTNATVTLIEGGKMPLKVMGHNFTLTKTSDWKAVAEKEAGRFPKDPADVPKDKRIIAASNYVGGAAGEPKEATVKIDISKLDRKADYHFFCSFPGHFATMNGAFVLEK